MPKYTIKKGDTLSQIAKKEGTTVAKLMEMNPQIKDKNLIITGQSLNLPYGASDSRKLVEAQQNIGKSIPELEARVKSATEKEAVAKAKAEIRAEMAKEARARADKMGKPSGKSSKKSGSFAAGVGTGVAGTAAAGLIAGKVMKGKAPEPKKNLPKNVKKGVPYVGKNKMIGVDWSTMTAKTKKVYEKAKDITAKGGGKATKAAISKATKIGGAIASKTVGKKAGLATKMFKGMMNAKVKK